MYNISCFNELFIETCFFYTIEDCLPVSSYCKFIKTIALMCNVVFSKRLVRNLIFIIDDLLLSLLSFVLTVAYLIS